MSTKKEKKSKKKKKKNDENQSLQDDESKEEDADDGLKGRSFKCGWGVIKWYFLDGKPWTDTSHRSFTIYLFIVLATWGCYSASEAGYFFYAMISSCFMGIIMSIYAVPKIKNIIDMRNDLRKLGKSHKKLKKVEEEFKTDIESVNKAHSKLDEIQQSIDNSNDKLKDSYANFSSFGNNLNRSNVENIKILKSLKYHFEECKSNYEALLTRSEKAFLNTIYMKIHKLDGEPGLSYNEFMMFIDELPSNYKKRFAPYDQTFEKYAGDDRNMDYKEFQIMTTNMARNEALRVK